MKYYAPDYYNDFECIASECRHNCCIGWEIDIDEETMEYYKTVQGDFGKKLRDNIAAGECPHFILGENERCPFLNSDNLCEIITNQSKDALCSICSEHPRYRNFYSDREEVGIGLSCEAAAKIIVSKKDKMSLVETFDDGEECEQEASETEFFKCRDEIFCILQNRNYPVSDRLLRLLEFCKINQPVLSDKQYALLYLELEYMQEEWHTILSDIAGKQPTAQIPSEFDTAFEQLAVYFFCRHLAKVFEGELLSGTVFFCVLSVRIIMLFCSYHLEKYGALTIDDIAEYARMYSAEVEYSPENTDYLISYFS